MIVPTIHLNGTSKVALLAALELAYDALGEAYDAIKETAPNGRDYYVQGPNAITVAGIEHHDRLKKVDEVREEIAEIINRVDQQGR
jgi:hypothetical protein